MNWREKSANDKIRCRNNFSFVNYCYFAARYHGAMNFMCFILQSWNDQKLCSSLMTLILTVPVCYFYVVVFFYFRQKIAGFTIIYDECIQNCSMQTSNILCEHSERRWKNTCGMITDANLNTELNQTQLSDKHRIGAHIYTIVYCGIVAFIWSIVILWLSACISVFFFVSLLVFCCRRRRSARFKLKGWFILNNTVYRLHYNVVKFNYCIWLLSLLKTDCGTIYVSQKPVTMRSKFSNGKQ